ncbi:NYN domain-containing protein [Levilactobacillus brevis]|uniref:NYN domain-containing protein n=1 Tax=Levilactobacillus brevis TaxID=1580 RepID=UPI000E0988D2|nr:NYN domain-containing protein [Levilactobacillus brevis]MBT9677574.1 NYN domain-containing protein [Levilactobacillus brevis]RDF84992.1 NYN domain-containing protein [Levilactobacillus brevis]
MKEDILIVDAYNMIGNWPKLNRLKLTDQLPEARDELLNMLANYKKLRDTSITVVFDAMYVPGISKSYRQFDLEVVWTNRDETADSYIERLAKERQTRFTQVTVATSDQAEQWTIFSEGALRIPAGELLRDIERAQNEVKQTAREFADRGLVRKSPWNDQQLYKLEKLRDQMMARPPKKKKD